MSRIESLEPGFKEQCESIIDELTAATGLAWVIIQARRTIAYQDGLFNQPTDGKDNDGDGRIDEADEKVTAARGGQSPHNYGLAADIGPVKNGEVWWSAPEKYWVMLCDAAEKRGLTAGYRFNIPGVGKDRPHVEHPSWREKRALWREGKLTVA